MTTYRNASDENGGNAAGGAAPAQSAQPAQFGLSNFALKMIAIVTMLIDHTGIIVEDIVPEPLYYTLRIVGRLAFPIFTFLLVEGLLHTHSAPRYLLRLAVFAAVSELPFNILHDWHVFDASAQNVFFTLAIGLALIYALELLRKGAGVFASLPAEGPARTVLHIALPICAAAFAEVLHTDYGAFGIVLIFAIYRFHGAIKTPRVTMGPAVVVAAVNGLSLFLYGVAQPFAAFAAIPIFFYNGKRGPRVKYAFYAFYPAHILALAAFAILALHRSPPPLR